MNDAFETGWDELLKAAPCTICGANAGERCDRNNKMPANRCKQRKNAAAKGFDNTRDLSVEDITPPEYLANRG
tara:strand:- start:9399 stop:9617 length:219 start_codon:yes stop_codon:yes gene_type:complete